MRYPPPPLPVADIADPQPLRPLVPAAPENVPETKLKPLKPSRLQEASPARTAAKPPEERFEIAETPPDPSPAGSPCACWNMARARISRSPGRTIAPPATGFTTI